MLNRVAFQCFPSRLRGNKTGGEVGILTQGMSADYEVIRWFPKMRGTSLGVPITRIMIFMRFCFGVPPFRVTFEASSWLVSGGL